MHDEGKRLTILTAKEIQTLYGLPQFTDEERDVYCCTRVLLRHPYAGSLILSALLLQAENAGKLEEATLIKRISPIAWRHVNFLGRFEFQKRHNRINLDEIINTLRQKTEWQRLKTTEDTADR